MVILIPAYWVNYGPGNFLWISDVTLIFGFVAVLLENKLIASMALVGGFLLESFWTIAFLSDILLDFHFSSIAEYMFDPALPLWLRLLSLFHVALPFLLIVLVTRLGYDRRAIFLQIPLTLVVLILSWSLTHPSENVNWVFSYLKLEMNPLLYLFLEWLFLTFLALMTHVVVLRTRKVVVQE